MKDTPILFSAPMVLAILEGRKTQTRRVVKPQPPEGFDPIPLPTGEWAWLRPAKKHLQVERAGDAFACPYGKADDRLWVRETWGVLEYSYHWEYGLECEGLTDDYTAKTPINMQIPLGRGRKHGIAYRADGYEKTDEEHWRPSIFMPRWASRINLEIVSVRVERVQEITEQDALAEGMCNYETKPTPKSIIGAPPETRYARIPQGQYAALWNTLNAKRGFGWDTNPFVWRLEFRRIT